MGKERDFWPKTKQYNKEKIKYKKRKREKEREDDDHLCDDGRMAQAMAGLV